MAIDKLLPQSPKRKQKEKKQREACRPVAVGRYLIVCEGTKTEPNYFKWYQTKLEKLKGELAQIKKKTEDIQVAVLGDEIEVEGKGMNTKSLVQKTIDKVNRSHLNYSEVWCVFDKDSFSAKDFNDAIFLARRNNIREVYSNEAFELWYLLHYDYHNAGISRTQYESILTERLGKPYKKNSATMYEDLLTSGGDQQRAINHAEKLLATYGDRTDYANHNPSTTVHLLVAALNQFLEDFRKKVDSFQ